MKIVRMAPVRLLIALAFFAGFMFAAVALRSYLAETIDVDNAALDALWRTALFVFAAIAGYVLYVRLVEGRAVRELSWRESFIEVSAGFLVGFGMITVVIGVLYVLGYYTASGLRSPGVLLAPFIGAWVAGVTEEIALRGIIFRIAEEWLGTWIALALSALLFGFLHLNNPNSSLLAAAAISIEAGVLLGAVYITTRRLWAAIGLHTGWNFTLGSVYGGAVSGGESEGLLVSRFDGPELATGGAFGVEASLVTMIVGLLLASIYLVRAARRGHIIAPIWARPRPSAPKASND